MRILSLMIRSVILLLIVAGIAFLIGREVLLALGMTKMREALSSARVLRIAPGTIAPQCQTSALTDPTQAIVEQVQLTFISDTVFELQLLCRSSLRQPVMISQFELPPFVKKIPGTSGLIWGPGTTGVTLEVWGRHRSLILEDQKAVFENGFLPAGIGTGPMASCSGYGFSCCPTDSTVGQGLQTSLVNDCPRTCYSQCITRPVVLSFTSQPFYDLETRVISISTGDEVIFSYVVNPGTGLTAESTLDFGDGTKDVSQDTAKSVSHLYTCDQSVCDYPVQLLLKDNRGIDSVNTPLSRFTVRVSGS